MKSAVKPIPEGYTTATPYLIVNNGTKALEFYKKAFGASILMVMPGPHNSVGHAEIKIGNSIIMLADESPQHESKSPSTIGGSPVSLYLYVEDCDHVFNRAVAAGAVSLRPLQDQFYGDRSGLVRDPFGHVWGIATHKED